MKSRSGTSSLTWVALALLHGTTLDAAAAQAADRAFTIQASIAVVDDKIVYEE
jgi:hypothetical protein